MPTLDDATLLAAQAHYGQKDRNNRPYILHPLRVMLRMEIDDEAATMVAILHDTIEDTDITLESLRTAGYPEEIVTAIDALSRRENENYDAYIDRVQLNSLACRVKLVDLEDHMDLLQINELSPQSLERLQKYHDAWKKLSEPIRRQRESS